MFDTQAIRLMREQWPSPQLLAEELFSIFTSEVPVEHNGPLVLGPGVGDEPLLQMLLPTGRDLSLPAISITRGNDTLNIGADGAITTVHTDPDTGEETEEPVGSGGGGGSGGTLGVVQSGTGQTYEVALYENGINSASTQTVTCTCPNVDADFDGDLDGAYVNVQEDAAGTFYFLADVWL